MLKRSLFLVSSFRFLRSGCTLEVVDDLVGRNILGTAVGECLKQYFTTSRPLLTVATSTEDERGSGMDAEVGKGSQKGMRGKTKRDSRREDPSANDTCHVSKQISEPVTQAASSEGVRAVYLAMDAELGNERQNGNQRKEQNHQERGWPPL